MGSSSNEVVSVIIASAQSVAKVFLIGAVGFGAGKFPRSAPFLPSESVSTVARFAFHTLLLSLIYSTTAVSVSVESIGNYWFVFCAAFGVLGISYVTATLLGRLPCCPIANPQDFCALRIAATFPNIVALPILIFPSLCEHEVVYSNFGGSVKDSDEPPQIDTVDSAAMLREQCTAEATTMIFIYFFGWSLLFWSFGHPQLMAAAYQKAAGQAKLEETITPADNKEQIDVEDGGEPDGSSEPRQQSTAAATVLENREDQSTTAESSSPVTRTTSGETSVAPTPLVQRILAPLKQTVTSPGFLALTAGILTGFIPPLKKALFEPGGALRFIGDAVQTLGQASSPISTMVVAASLCPTQTRDTNHTSRSAVDKENEENPIMSDPNFGPRQRPSRRRSSLQRIGDSVRSSFRSARKQSPEQRKLLVWFTLSRLIVSPALVVGTLVLVDSHLPASSVPPLSKLVVVVNAALPGALIVVVLLKSQPALTDSAAAVANVYLPTYLVSIFTIAAWTSVGLWIALPSQ